jgi:hypothetical protein
MKMDMQCLKIYRKLYFVENKRGIMKVSEIVKDSLRYPFSDWKKILIFGIIILIGNFINNIFGNE